MKFGYFHKQLVLTITAMLFVGLLYADNNFTDSLVSPQIAYKNSNDLQEKLNREQYVELKEKIIAVQSENDKRFVVFLWGIGIIISLVLTIVIVGSFNNKKAAIQSAKETAREEFIREYKIYKRKFNEMLSEIKQKKVEIENLKFEFEQYQAMVKEASIVSNSINLKSNENGNIDNSDASKAK